MKKNRSPSPSPKRKSPNRKGIIRSVINWLSRPKKQKPPKMSVKSIVALKTVVRRRATRKAAKNRTFAFNKIEKAALGLNTKRNNLPPPPGFIGTNKQKYERALTYRTRLTKFAKTHPVTYNQPLYRGISGSEFYKFFVGAAPVHKTNMSSFSKNYDVARIFAETSGPPRHRAVLVLDSVGQKIPSVNYTTGYFTSRYAHEQEVLLPPGTFYKLGMDINRRHGMDLIHVRYVPD